MELMRPRYMVREADSKAGRDYNHLHFIQCACRFTERCATCGGEKGSKRDEMKELIAELRKRCDTIDMNIFNSVHNINPVSYTHLDVYKRQGNHKRTKILDITTGKTAEKKMAGKTAVKTDVKAGRFRQKVLSVMKKNHMTDRGDSVLAAVSGGADSVCLLLLLHEMAAELGIKVFAFHMNHGIRGAEADRDERFVMELCERLNIPLTVAHEKVEEYAAELGLSGEEAGRILRYHHLGETAEKYQCAKIAVAHHEDDDAETVLLNLFRGSGLAGLSGIRPVRENIKMCIRDRAYLIR